MVELAVSAYSLSPDFRVGLGRRHRHLFPAFSAPRIVSGVNPLLAVEELRIASLSLLISARWEPLQIGQCFPYKFSYLFADVRMCSFLNPFSFLTRLCDPSSSHIVDGDITAAAAATVTSSAAMPGLVAKEEEKTSPSAPTTTQTVPVPNKPAGKTFAHQDKLPHLPIPPLEDTCKRYLKALEPLQDEYEHEETKRAVEDFLEHDGPRIQRKLVEWAKTKDRYVDQCWLFCSLSLLIGCV